MSADSRAAMAKQEATEVCALCLLGLELDDYFFV